MDWTGSSGGSGKGDIFVVIFGDCTTGRVGIIPASYHGALTIGNVPSNEEVPTGAYVYPMDVILNEPPKQGVDITCAKGPFRWWQGSDMSRDGRLIALITGQSPPRIYVYPLASGETVLAALTAESASVAASCPYIASTSYGL